MFSPICQEGLQVPIVITPHVQQRRYDVPPWNFQIYQGFHVILTNSQTSHVLHLALLAWCVMNNLAVLLGT
jgi:hypothetical protein